MTPAAIAALSSTAAAALAGTATYAALSSASQLFGPILIDGPNANQIGLTFDDGPNPAATPQLLDLLAEHNTRATFFLVGKYVRQHLALTRQIAAAGHLIGNHSMTHPWLAWQTHSRIRAEITDCSNAIQDTLGTSIHFFRPPHGARRPAVLRTARTLGLTPVNWNLIVQDWKAPDAAVLLDRIERGIGRNHRAGRATNLVLHDGDGLTPNADRRATLEATRRLLALCSNSSHHFVTPEAWL